MKIKELVTEALTLPELIRDIEHEMAELEDMFKAKDFELKDEKRYEVLVAKLQQLRAQAKTKKKAPVKKRMDPEKRNRRTKRRSVIPPQDDSEISGLFPPDSNDEDWERDWKKLFPQAIKQIKQDCQPFLKEAGANKLGLYRGIDQPWNTPAKKLLLTKRVRLDDRAPLGMSYQFQKGVNNYFEQEFGQPFRFSALGIGSRLATGTFGNAHWMFPIGDFTFLWSPRVKDLNRTMWDNSLIDHREENPKKVKRIIDEFWPKMDYRTTDLPAAIESRSEIMIRCQTYHALHYDIVTDHLKLSVQDLWNMLT